VICKVRSTNVVKFANAVTHYFKVNQVSPVVSHKAKNKQYAQPSLHDYQSAIYRYQCCEALQLGCLEYYQLVIIEVIPSYHVESNSKPKMNELGVTIIKNQPFRVLFPETQCYIELANQNPLQCVQPLLSCSLQYSILCLTSHC